MDYSYIGDIPLCMRNWVVRRLGIIGQTRSFTH
jgi:hypothetical protein